MKDNELWFVQASSCFGGVLLAGAVLEFFTRKGRI